MPELSLREQLQPALLDRLTDDDPNKTVETREQGSISLDRLRQYILRDLTWLLNSVHLEATHDLTDYPNVTRSALNFGIPGYAGQVVSSINLRSLRESIKNAILRFEPRLLPQSLNVTLVADNRNDGSHTVIALEIDAELWAQPTALHLRMKTELDLEMGVARVTERAERDARRDERRYK